MKKEENKNVARKAADNAAKKAAKAVAAFAATEKAAIEAANARINGGLSKLAAEFFAAGQAAKAAGLTARYVLSAPAAQKAFADYAAARNAAVTQTACYKAAYAAADCAARGVYADFAAYTAAIKENGGRWAKNPAPAADKSAAIRAGVAAKKAATPAAKNAPAAQTATTESAARPVVAPSAPTPAKSDGAKERAEKARRALAACAAYTDDELVAAARDNRVAAKRLFAVLTAALAVATPATRAAKKTA